MPPHVSVEKLLKDNKLNAESPISDRQNIAVISLEFKQIEVTVMILSFQTDMSGQIMQTQIRLFLEEQSDQGLHCLLKKICIFLTKYPKVWPVCLNFRKITANIFGVRKFRNFTV